MTQPRVSRMCLVGGKEVGEGPYLGTYKQGWPRRELRLFLVAEPFPEPAEELALWAREGLGKALLEWKGSLTSGLEAAVKEMHQDLWGKNEPRWPRERLGVGLAGAALSGDTAYIFQAGPCLSLAFSGGSLKPAGPPQEPLGMAPDPQFHISGQVFQPGDSLLLASSALSRVSPREGLKFILNSPPEQAWQRLTMLAEGLPLFACFFLSFPGKGG